MNTFNKRLVATGQQEFIGNKKKVVNFFRRLGPCHSSLKLSKIANKQVHFQSNIYLLVTELYTNVQIELEEEA